MINYGGFAKSTILNKRWDAMPTFAGYMTLKGQQPMILISNANAPLNSRRSEITSPAQKVNQLGINMVDLMMWLVIAALLLAAALQGIGFYQKAAWNYQLSSDASAVRTYMESAYTLNGNKYTAIIGATPADLKLTTSNGAANTVAVVLTTQGGWAATLCSGALKKANGDDGTGAALIFGSTPSAPVKGDC